MKIVVISYDELNKLPTSEQVISDLIKVYKAAPVTCHENMGKTLRSQIDSLIDKTDNAIVSFMNNSVSERINIEKFVNEEKPDLLISYNLAGFEISTLTDSVLYNLLNCRQFHFINIPNLPNEKYLDRLLSINLFIFHI